MKDLYSATKLHSPGANGYPDSCLLRSCGQADVFPEHFPDIGVGFALNGGDPLGLPILSM